MPVAAVAGGRLPDARAAARARPSARVLSRGHARALRRAATRQLLPATSDVLDRLMAAMRSLGARRGSRDRAVGKRRRRRARRPPRRRRVDASTLEQLAATDGLTGCRRRPDAAAPVRHRHDLTIGDAPVTLRRHVLAFFQGNRYLLSDLVAHVVERGADWRRRARSVCGRRAVSRSPPRSRAARVVTAVEGDRVAAADLQANAAQPAAQFTTVRASVEGIGTERLQRGRACASPATETSSSIRRGPACRGRRSTGVLRLTRAATRSTCRATSPRSRATPAASSTPATRSTRVDAFDLFPNTPHVETVVVFAGVADLRSSGSEHVRA